MLPVPRVLAVDIGGTKLAAGVVDDSGTLTGATSVPTAGADGEHLFANLVALIDGVLAAAVHPGQPPLVALGVGCGGPMRSGGDDVSPLNIPQWRSFPLASRLAARFGLPVHVDNDAKALALAEGWCGAARAERNFVALVVSTGVGGGVVVDGRLLDGESGNAGHLGHVVVEPEGRPCACGGQGCLEAEISGLAIAARTGRPAAEASHDERVRAGTLLGRGVAAAVALADVRLACVAGSVALGFGDVFFDAANVELARRAGLSFARGARIVPAGLGASGPLVGAAALAFRHLGHPTLAT